MEQKAYYQPPGYEHSIEAKIIDMSNKADKAAWILAKACTDTKNRTKEQMIEAMTQAQIFCMEIRGMLTGK